MANSAGSSAFAIAFTFLSAASTSLEAAPKFRRADANTDGVLNITDAIYSLGYLFLGAPDRIPCQDAADANDDGEVDLADPIGTLFYIFLGSPPPPPPFGSAAADCGVDPTADPIGCERFDPCPLPLPPPALPVFEPPISPTGEESMGLRGSAPPGLLVRITGGASAVPIEARVEADGTFAATVALAPNRLNRIFAVVEDAQGRVSAPAVVEVVQDSEAPFVFVDEPADGARVLTDRITVTGRVSDLLSGYQGLDVTVNGVLAAIAIGIGTNGTFERASVPLLLGENTLSVVAMDAVGNTASRQVQVTREDPPPGSSSLELLGGNGQPKQPIHATLPQPIVVRASKADGSALPGKLVLFRVTRSDGRLAIASGAAPEDRVMALSVRTDVDGLASAYWTLGSDAGCGNNRVRATATGLAGEVLFCASAAPGPAAQINIGTGNNQRGETGAPAREALKAWVSDGCNGVEGVPVTFRVLHGEGKVNGGDSVTVLTSATGHAQVSFVLGLQPGNQAVEADFVRFDGSSSLPATFIAYALERDETRPTTFSGLVLDNAEQPIQGAVCLLEVPGFEGAQALTNIHGRFELQAPGAGPASVRVEGKFATHVGGEAGADVALGTFPSLEYEVTLVPNAENSLPAPVLLPRLDPANVVVYNGTSEAILRVEGVEGLEMRIAAGTIVTLRDGTRVGPGHPGSVELSLNQVHHDDVPMPMTDGAAPPFAWTLQPGGASFDPPIRVKYPNMVALPPGAIANFLSFNHDTQKFEIVSSGKVSVDGSTIDSDPGSGITVAGWGGNCPPYAVTSTVERKRPKKPEDCNFTIQSVDPYFAPSVERLHIKYTLVPLAAHRVQLEIYEAADPSNPLFTDNWVTPGGSNLEYKQRSIAGWDGKANQGPRNGQHIRPCNYVARLTVLTSSHEPSEGCTDSKLFAVEVESVEFNKAEDEKIDRNDPARKETIEATVKLRKKDGTGIATAVPIEVHWSFADPGDDNTLKASSHADLGKRGDANEIYWEGPQSDDGFKLTCISETGAAGKAMVVFLSSAVGGDDFQIKAAARCQERTVSVEESGKLTVVRSVRFDKIFEMQGLTHVSRNALKAKIQPYFDPAFVEYDAGAPNAIPASHSVKYIGLWGSVATPQLSWGSIQTKLPIAWSLSYGPHAGSMGDSEIPTAQELADAAYAGTDIVLLAVRDVAREDITKKAQAWAERLDSGFVASSDAWKAAAGIPAGSIVGIQHYNPKYSLLGGDAATNEWPEWVRVTTYFDSYAGLDPDGGFVPGGGTFGGLADSQTGTVTVPDGFSDATNENTIAHEAGHATKAVFQRVEFGPSLDHSAQPGLMDPMGSLNSFTSPELKILRGIKP